MHPITDLVSEGISKSKALLLLAESSEWEQFSDLDAERQEILRSINLDNLVLSDSEHNTLQALMNELITLNTQLESLCIKQRSDVVQELQKISKGNKVSKAYSQ